MSGQGDLKAKQPSAPQSTLEHEIMQGIASLFGHNGDSYDIDKVGFLAAAITSSQYANRMMAKAHRCPNDLDLLSFAAAAAKVEGLVLEFGVYSGRTANHLASLYPKQNVFGFDSFEGLPEDWRADFQKGEFHTHGLLPRVRDNVGLVKGWFDHTLPLFLDQYPGKLALLHIDCDLYSSTVTVLHQLRTRIVPGTVIAFNEYFNYPGWENHEHKAFREFTEQYRIGYEYIALVANHQQVAARITHIPV